MGWGVAFGKAVENLGYLCVVFHRAEVQRGVAAGVARVQVRQSAPTRNARAFP